MYLILAVAVALAGKTFMLSSSPLSGHCWQNGSGQIFGQSWLEMKKEKEKKEKEKKEKSELKASTLLLQI